MSTGLAAAEACGLALGYVLHWRAKLVQFLMVVFWQSIRFSAEVVRPTPEMTYDGEEQLFAQFFSRGIAVLPKRFDMVAWNDWNEKKPKVSEA